MIHGWTAAAQSPVGRETRRGGATGAVARYASEHRALRGVFVDSGLPPGTAGLLLAVTIIVGVPVSVVVPALAARSWGQRTWTVGLTGVSALGILGLVHAPSEGAWLWAVLLGVGSGAFPLALSMFELRSTSVGQTLALSAFAQSSGYLVAAAGPLLLGGLRGATGGWAAPLRVLLLLLVVQALAGWVAGRPGSLTRP